MPDDVVLEMMPADFILWRCLHGGPLTKANIDEPAPSPGLDWPALRARNLPLLRALTDVHGACAVVARDGDSIVGTLRFYPRAVWSLAGSIGFCLQQPFPSGPPEGFAWTGLRPLEAMEDRTLAVHCLAVGQPGAADDPRRRKGLGTRMVQALVEWARPRGWRAIEAATYVDLDVLYSASGAAGRSFWEKLGFRHAGTSVEPELQKESEFLQAMRREARARGIPQERLADKYTMRLTLA